MLKKTLTLFLGNVIAVVAGIFSLHQMASILTKVEYGAYAYLMGVFTMCFVLTDFGLAAAHIKAVADGRDVKNCFRTYMTLELALVVLTSAALSGIVLPQYLQMMPAPRQETRYSYFLLLGSWAATLASTAVSYTFSGLMQSVRQIVPSVVRSVVLVILLAAMRTGHSLRDVCASSLASSLVGLAAAAYMARGFFGGRFCREMAIQYWQYARRLVPGLITGSIGKNIDTVLVGRLVSLHDLAPYFAGKRFLTPLEQLGCSIDSVLFPTLSAHLAAGRRNEARRTFLETERAVLALVSLIIAIAVFFSREILTIVLGESYTSFAPLFGALIAGGCSLYLLSLPCMSVFNALGAPQTTSILNVLASGVLIFCDIIFIPARIAGLPVLGLGASGAVIGLALAAALLAASARMRVRKMLGAGFEFTHLVCAGSAVASAWLTAALLRSWVEAAFWRLSAVLLLVTATHIATVWKFGKVMLPNRLHAESPRQELATADEETVSR